MRHTVVCALMWLVTALPAFAQLPTPYGGLKPVRYAACTDAGTGDGSSEANAIDLPTALTTAIGGNRVIGVHIGGACTRATTGRDSNPSFAITISGASAAAPVVVVAKYAALDLPEPIGSNANRSELRVGGNTLCANSGNSPAIGTTGSQSFIEVIGFYFNARQAPHAPSGGIVHIEGGNGLKVKKVVVDDANGPGCSSDNFNAISMEQCDDCEISDSWIRGGADGAGGNHNRSAITTYASRRFLITHCRFDDVLQAIFVKGSDGAGRYNSGEISYNWLDVDDTVGHRGIDVDEVVAAEGLDITRNVYVGKLLADNSNALVVALNDVPANPPNNIRIRFNTAINGALFRNFSPGLTKVTLEDNVAALLSSSPIQLLQLGPRTVSQAITSSARNCYYTPGGAEFVQNSTSYTGVASKWRGSPGSPDAGSAEANPNFVNARAGNYRLASGPCTTLSSTKGPVGAYTTGSEVIGARMAAARR